MGGQHGGRAGVLACALGTIASLALCAPRPAGAATAGTPPRGIDVSAFQHLSGSVIDWDRLAAAGYRFAAIKATEGGYYVNPYYASDASQAARAGLYVMPYAFANPAASDGASQARYALLTSRYRRGGMMLPPELDLENDPYTVTDHAGDCYGLTRAAMVAWIAAFTTEITRLTGERPVIYTTPAWWETCTGDSAAFSRDPLWVAAYHTAAPDVPPAWPGWTFWQYTSHGLIPGDGGRTQADIDYFQGAPALLRTAGFARFMRAVTLSPNGRRRDRHVREHRGSRSAHHRAPRPAHVRQRR